MSRYQYLCQFNDTATGDHIAQTTNRYRQTATASNTPVTLERPNKQLLVISFNCFANLRHIVKNTTAPKPHIIKAEQYRHIEQFSPDTAPNVRQAWIDFVHDELITANVYYALDDSEPDVSVAFGRFTELEGLESVLC